MLYIYSVPPDDGLQICPKHVEGERRNKLRINSASSWFLLHRYSEMHGQQNIKIKQEAVNDSTISQMLNLYGDINMSQLNYVMYNTHCE